MAAKRDYDIIILGGSAGIVSGVMAGALGLRVLLIEKDKMGGERLKHLGLTEEDAKARGLAYEVYCQPFAQNDRAITDNEAQGVVKVLTNGLGGKIMGVHIFGPRGSELMQEWTLAMRHSHSIRDIADLVHIYPTLSLACQHAAQR